MSYFPLLYISVNKYYMLSKKRKANPEASLKRRDLGVTLEHMDVYIHCL